MDAAALSRLKDAKAEHARIMHEISERRFVARDGITVGEYLDRWEPAHGRDLEAGSRAVIRYSLQRVRDRLGDRPLQSITRADVDALVDWLSSRPKARRQAWDWPQCPLGPADLGRILAGLRRRR